MSELKRFHKDADMLRRLLVGGVSLAALVPVSAIAQDDPIDIDQAIADEQDGDSIIVTGSRIRRTELEGNAPIFTFGEVQLEERGFTNVADALNQSPLFGGSLTPNGGQSGFTAGQNQVNLFDLGTQRTLTLVNGRRLVSSNSAAIGGGQVDLNTIPLAVVERIETVPLTGAAIYGSDAIAGTVNVILKDDFEGIEFRGTLGVVEEIDVPSYQASVVAGANFDDNRGNIVFSVEYTQDEGALECARDYLCQNNPDLDNSRARFIDGDGDGQFDDQNGDGTIDNNDLIPVQFVFNELRLALFDQFGSIAPPGSNFLPPFGLGRLDDGNFYRFTPGGDLETCEGGPSQTRSILTRGGNEVCGLDFFDQVTQIRSPVERINLFGKIKYDLTDNITYRTDFIFANTEGSELVNQGGFQTTFFGGTSAPIRFSTDNPFLSDQARGIIEGNGLDSFDVLRFNNDLVGLGANSNETTVWRMTNVIEGRLELFDREFFWDVSNVWGRSDIQVQTTGIVDGRFLNAVDARRLDDTLLEQIRLQDPDDLTDDLGSLDDALATLQDSSTFAANFQRGDIICGAYADLAAGTLEGFNSRASGSGLVDEDIPFLDGCVPLNLFGSQASPEALNFITGGPQISTSANEQTVWAANFGGSLIELPAGDLGFNIGVESRREVSDFAPTVGLIVPITRSSVSQGISGRLTTREVYGEFRIPVVSPDMNIPLVNSFDIDGAVRYQSARTTAPSGDQRTTDATVYQASAKWSPIEDISFRGTYATAFRNPSFTELFLPASQTFILGADPCDSRSQGLGPNPDVRRQNCESIGIDTSTFISNIQDGTIPGGIDSGNPGLTPERNKSWSVGVTASPRWVDGLGIAIDYYNLEIEDFINDVDFAILAATCFDSNDFPNEPSCDTFVRDENFQVVQASNSPANVANSTFEAITARVFYNFELNDAASLIGLGQSRDLGRVSFDAFTQHNRTNEFQATPASEVTEDVGDFADPKWLGTFDTNYSLGNFRMSYRIRWQGPANIDALEQQNYAVDFTPLTVGGQSGFQAIIENRVDARLIHDLGLTYDLTDNFQIQVNAINLANRVPNTLEQAVGAFGIDERLGRRFTFRATASF